MFQQTDFEFSQTNTNYLRIELYNSKRNLVVSSIECNAIVDLKRNFNNINKLSWPKNIIRTPYSERISTHTLNCLTAFLTAGSKLFTIPEHPHHILRFRTSSTPFTPDSCTKGVLAFKGRFVFSATYFDRTERIRHVWIAKPETNELKIPKEFLELLPSSLHIFIREPNCFKDAFEIQNKQYSFRLTEVWQNFGA